jgi:hypothetical protein
MCRRYGRAPHGQRLIAFVPHGHWNITTFLGALRHNGMTAPLVIDGALNGELFRADVEQMLAPTLSPGEIVTMDNPTRSRAFARQSRHAGQACSICRHTRPISIRSRWPSPSSNSSGALLPHAPARRCGTSSARAFMPSQQLNAPTISLTAAIFSQGDNALGAYDFAFTSGNFPATSIRSLWQTVPRL